MKSREEIQSLCSVLSLYWGTIVSGIWIFQQPQVKNIVAGTGFLNVLTKIIFIVLAILLFSTLVTVLVRYIEKMEDDGNEPGLVLKAFKFKKENVKGLKFTDYLRNFHRNHPILTLSIIGLVVNQIYFTNAYNKVLNFFKQIPLLSSFYTSWFSAVPLIALIITSEYIVYVKNDIIRRILKIFVYINYPVILAGILLGLCSISVYPALSIISSSDPISHVIEWVVKDTKNFLFALCVPLSVIHLWGNVIIKESQREFL